MHGHFAKLMEKVFEKKYTPENGQATNARMIEKANKGVEVIDLE